MFTDLNNCVLDHVCRQRLSAYIRDSKTAFAAYTRHLVVKVCARNQLTQVAAMLDLLWRGRRGFLGRHLGSVW